MFELMLGMCGALGSKLDAVLGGSATDDRDAQLDGELRLLAWREATVAEEEATEREAFEPLRRAS